MHFVWVIRSVTLCAVLLLVMPVIALANHLGAEPLTDPDGAKTKSTIERVDLVRFGGDSNYSPFEWVTQSGEAKGFIVDLERALAKQGERRLVHVTGTWAELVSALDDGSIDILPMFVSPDRETRYTFSKPFYFFKHAIFAKPGLHGLTGLDNLSGLRVAVEDQSFAQERLATLYSDVKVLGMDGTLETLHAVINGDADVAVIAVPVANGLISTHKLAIERYGMPFWSEGYAFATRKDRTELAEWVNQSLEKLLNDGDYDAVFEQWKDELEPHSASFGYRIALVAPYIALSAGLLLFAAAGAFWWYYHVVRAAAREGADFGPITESLIAYHDSRTGMPGVDLFSRQLENILRGADTDRKRWKYAIICLSDFESTVQIHGVSAVAALVSIFADRLREQNYRAIGYFGRGYFGVLSERPIFRLGHYTLLDPVEVPSMDVVSDVMCGIARIPVGAQRLDDFSHFAETALSQCTVRHRKWLVYNSTMEPDPIDTRIVRAFRQGEVDGLSVVYQPQMSVASGAIVGLESLIRWQHPILGSVPPGKFIPLIEQAGLIGKVTDFVLNNAASLCARMASEGRPVGVSVNLSVHDLEGADIYDKIASCLDRNKCPASQFMVELTETAFTEDPEMVQFTLTRLRRLGVKVSIDDFGTGFSSMSYLSEFPADEVKIDRLFVSRMRHSSKDRAIIRSTIQLAHEIGLVVVAEGVEDRETLAMLREEKCDRVQGYEVCRPLEEEKLYVFLEKGTLEVAPDER